MSEPTPPAQTTEASPPARRRARPLIATVALLIVAIVATGDWLDDSADGYYEDAFKRALVTFALARALNGVISVIQGTEVAVEPAGVGVTFTPGEIVDPINDLIERFSWIMLASTTSLGMQKILMDMSAWSGARVILLVAIALVLVALWWRPNDRRLRRWAVRFVLLAMFLRLAMPLIVVLNNAVYDVFMKETYEHSSLIVEQTNRQLEDMAQQDEPPAQPEEGWLSSMRRWIDDKTSALDVRARMAAYRDRFTEATEHLLRLSAVFILQTIVFPLLFLWLLAKAVGNVGRFR